ncbi:MAG TPA: hypothetical protein VJT16_13635 [Streptosporangiaceae bacterium]|nr:hypothetical protein [Streptosporangiaceae bacterium]
MKVIASPTREGDAGEQPQEHPVLGHTVQPCTAYFVQLSGEAHPLAAEYPKAI